MASADRGISSPLPDSLPGSKLQTATNPNKALRVLGLSPTTAESPSSEYDSGFDNNLDNGSNGKMLQTDKYLVPHSSLEVKRSQSVPMIARTAKAKVVDPKKEHRDQLIQDTNNSSIVSKRSVEKLYYDGQPEYFRYFVGKFKRRSPLINRGYWLRMKAIEYAVSRFLSERTAKRKVVINLGCGQYVYISVVVGVVYLLTLVIHYHFSSSASSLNCVTTPRSWMLTIRHL